MKSELASARARLEILLAAERGPVSTRRRKRKRDRETEKQRLSDYRGPRYRSVIRAPPYTRVHRAIECVDVRLEARAIERDGIE